MTFLVRKILVFILLFLCNMAEANTIIGPNTIIDKPTQFKNVTLDMSHGNFIVKNNAMLTIQHCTIKGTLSKATPTLFNVEKGALTLNDNEIYIQVKDINPHVSSQSLAHVIFLNDALLELKNNKALISTPYAAGFLLTNHNIVTKKLHIANNELTDFHGVLYLLNTEGAIIEHNNLKRNSYGNIVLIGKHSVIRNNTILYAGRDKISAGDAIDVYNSEHVDVLNNLILTPGCYGIWVMASNYITLSNNTITGGVTYAMHFANVNTFDNTWDMPYLMNHNNSAKGSEHITITNNIFLQNRYGIDANQVNYMTIKNNYFSQYFLNASSRRFWTDNSLLLKKVTHLIWENNYYKEAYTQENKRTLGSAAIVPYPASGGVVLN